MSGSPCSVAATFATSARLAAESIASILTSAMTLRSDRAPVAFSSARLAASLSELRSVKPPWWSWPATGPPRMPAAIANASANPATSQALPLVRRAIRSSMSVLLSVGDSPRRSGRDDGHLREGVERSVAVEFGIDQTLKRDPEESSPDRRSDGVGRRARRVFGVLDHRLSDLLDQDAAAGQEGPDLLGHARVVHGHPDHVEDQLVGVAVPDLPLLLGGETEPSLVEGGNALKIQVGHRAAALESGKEEVVLGLEVVMRQASRKAGTAGDVLHHRLVVAIFDQRSESGVDDPALRLLPGHCLPPIE